MNLGRIALFGLSFPLLGQMPEPWSVNKILGQDVGTEGPWYGVGTWAADSHGTLGTFVNSLGMGNALKGVGIHLEGGAHFRHWELAVQGIAIHDPRGQSYLSLYQGHITHHNDEGWITSLEQEPLVWGYGLNGGYLLGEAARPFPRLRFESPMTHLQWGKAHFGTWSFQAFMGRLEKDRVLSDSIQDLSYRKPALSNDPSAPFFNGYRVQAVFAEVMEFYVNYTNLWGGTRQGTSMTQGYNFSEYLTAMFGLKDQLAEGNVNFSDQNRQDPTYKNNARSASNIDLGARLRLRFLERILDAKAVHAYVSRGSKNMWWPINVFMHKPIYYLGKDIEKDGKNILTGGYSFFWNEKEHKSVPNLVAPNDTVGFLISWPEVRLGLEYSDITNRTSTGIKAFVNGVYPSGFYSYGDPLGNAIGGEAITTTLRLDLDPISKISTSTWFHFGHRPFRDDPSLWMADHPESKPAKNRFVGLQQTIGWNFSSGSTAHVGASWQRQGAVENIGGRSGNSFRWFVDLSHHWASRSGSRDR